MILVDINTFMNNTYEYAKLALNGERIEIAISEDKFLVLNIEKPNKSLIEIINGYGTNEVKDTSRNYFKSSNHYEI